MSDNHESFTSHKATAQYDRVSRYANNWRELFATQYKPLLRKGMTILDVGSGRTPAIPVETRPYECRYIGLDISAEELAHARPGSYDDEYAIDLKHKVDTLTGEVDLAISWQVLEHITPLPDAVSNVCEYLRPGGHFVSLLSGANAHYALINRFVPQRLGVGAMKHLLNRSPDSVFRAHYDSCTFSGLERVFADWSKFNITPLYRGADYYSFFKPAASAYLLYEDWAVSAGKKDLATHYLVVAMK